MKPLHLLNSCHSPGHKDIYVREAISSKGYHASLLDKKKKSFSPSVYIKKRFVCIFVFCKPCGIVSVEQVPSTLLGLYNWSPYIDKGFPKKLNFFISVKYFNAVLQNVLCIKQKSNISPSHCIFHTCIFKNKSNYMKHNLILILCNFSKLDKIFNALLHGRFILLLSLF